MTLHMHDPGLSWPQIEEHVCIRPPSSPQTLSIVAAFSSKCLGAWDVLVLLSRSSPRSHQQSIPARPNVAHGPEPVRFARQSALLGHARRSPKSIGTALASKSTRTYRPTLCARRRWLLRTRSACGSMYRSRVCTRVCAVLGGLGGYEARHSRCDMDSGCTLVPVLRAS